MMKYTYTLQLSQFNFLKFMLEHGGGANFGMLAAKTTGSGFPGEVVNNLLCICGGHGDVPRVIWLFGLGMYVGSVSKLSTSAGWI